MPYQIVLPDGRTYEIRYNVYGEIARLTLPTSGRIDYTHGAGLASPYGSISRESGQVHTPFVGTSPSQSVGAYAYVYRRLHARREYVDSGGTQISARIYSQPSRINTSSGLLESVSTDPNRTHTVTVNEGLSYQKSEFYYQPRNGWSSTSNSAVVQLSIEPITVAPPESPWEGRLLEQKDYDTNGSTLLRTTNNAWLLTTHGVYLSTTDVTLGTQKKREAFTYDGRGNVLTATVYGWVPSSQTPSTVLKTTTNAYENTSSYLNPPVHLRGLLKTRTITGGGVTSTVNFHYDEFALTNRTGAVGHDSGIYGTGYATRGNTTRSVQVATFPGRANRTITIENRFDILGNVVSFKSPRGHTTTFTYNDAAGTSGCIPSNSFAFATGISNPVSHTWSYKHDFCTGQIVEETDPNNSKTELQYNDLLDRITQVTRAAGHATAAQRTRFVYNNTARTITTYRSKDTTADDAIWSEITYDGLGRTTQTRRSDGQGTVFADTQYDDFHRVKSQSSPYRSGGTVYWTTTTYDGLGRIKTQVAPGSATTSYLYTSNVTRITDPVGVWRESTIDGAGRLISVKEGTNDVTNYTYDGLDNLRTVSQDVQSRSFEYDTAGALARVTNPESGIHTYFYDAGGNLTQTNLPQGGTVTYSYDNIDRQTQVTYSDSGTPDVTYTWDTSSKMRLYRARAYSGANTVAQTTFSSYDPLGRALASSQEIQGAPAAYNFTYSYDRAGNLRTMGYPSGRSLTITYTVGELIQQLSGVKSSVTTHYLSGISYTPFGDILQATLANGLIERTDYLNGLPQVRQIRLGTSGNPTERGDWQFRYCSSFGTDSCSGNNGNVLGQRHTIAGVNLNQTYQYDSLNRLCSVRETPNSTPLAPRNCGDTSGLGSGEAWYQAFTHDRWGNLATPANPGISAHPLTVTTLAAYNTANNRLTGSNWAYDNAGNLTKHGGWTLAYDAANRVKTSQPTGGSITTYVYDGGGKRVKKTTGSVSTYFVYDAFGQLAAEYSSVAPTGAEETHVITADHLGSTRLVTRKNGTVVSRHDYLPFGWELYSGVNGRTTGQGYLTTPSAVADPSQRFTGKERDQETGLDYFGARYFSSGQGRFTSVDPLAMTYTRKLDPQGLNLYSYTRNRPMSMIDVDGLATVVVTVSSNLSATVRHYSDGGLLTKSYSGLGRGRGRQRTARNNDTPFGKYRITRTHKGRLSRAFGNAKVDLLEISGEVKDSGRSEIRLHGGGSSLADPYAPRQTLVATLGCVRMHNEDVEDLVDELGLGELDGNDYIYIGSPEYLKITAIFEPQLRKILDKETDLKRYIWQVLLQKYERMREEEERGLRERGTSIVIN